MATTEEMRRRLRRISYWFLPVTAFVFVTTVLSLMGIDSEPWLWIRTIILAVAVTVLCVQVTGLRCGSVTNTGANAAKTPSTRSGQPGATALDVSRTSPTNG
ncbi:hypothetical protein AB0O52_11050 [Arthrobacter sp. NPDC080073]|uniref:hypothetical protein n=1 Tax=Arthrobacter sp. NPDC080073 TaxID=3155919 RepID=UPI003412000A